MSDWFGNAHPETGPWYSLKGGQIAPHIQMPLESGNTGDPRFNGKVAPPQSWTASLKPHEGSTGANTSTPR
jgi:hypothetical protein